MQEEVEEKKKYWYIWIVRKLCVMITSLKIEWKKKKNMKLTKSNCFAYCKLIGTQDEPGIYV